MPSNSGKPLDSAGNVQVDFVWGNFAPQPNDVRTTATDATVQTSSATAADLVDPTKKRVVPGKDKHDDLLAGYGGYPAFSANDDGAYTVATTTGGTTGNAQYTFNTLVNVPKLDGLTDVNAKDALRDNGFTGTLTPTSVAGGRIAITEAARTGTAVTFKSVAHGLAAGDVIAVYGLASTVATLNGAYTVNSASLTADTFQVTHPTSGSIINVTNIATAYAVVVSKTIATTGAAVLSTTASATLVSNVLTNSISVASTTGLVPGLVAVAAGIPTGATVVSVSGTTVVLSAAITASLSSTSIAFYPAAGSFSLPVASTTLVTVGMSVTGTGIASGTTVQYLNGTTVGLSLPTTAYIGTGAVTFATSETPVVAARTVAYSGSATAGTATVNTVAAHGLNVGDSVSVIGSTVLAATTGIVPNASTALVVADATNIASSAVVTGPGIPAGTTVSSITGTAVTLSGSATSTAALVAGSVVTTGTATSGSTALTIPTGTGVNVATNTVNGHLVTGVGIPDGTYVSSGGGTTSITLSKATTLALSTTSVTFSLAKFASGTAGSTSLTVDNATALVVGQTVTGAGILDGTIITAISGTTLTLSQAPLGTFSSKKVTFSNLLTFGTAATSKLNSSLGSLPVAAVQVTAVPSSTQFQYALTGLTGAANIPTSSDNFVVAAAASTNATVTLNVASGTGAAYMVGAIVTGAGIPDGTFVTARSTDALTISKALTADVTAGALLVFYPASVIAGVRTSTVVIGSQNVSGAQAGSTAITYNIYN